MYVLRSNVGVVHVEGVADLERTPVESLDGQSVHGDPLLYSCVSVNGSVEATLSETGRGAGLLCNAQLPTQSGDWSRGRSG